MNDKKIHGVFKITPITPIHISDGEKYQIFEYYIDDQNIFHLKDVMKFFQDNYEDYKTAMKIIEDLSFRPGHEYIRYTLPVYIDEQSKKTTSFAQPKSLANVDNSKTKHTKMSPEMAKVMKEAEKKLKVQTQTPTSKSVYQPTQEIFSFIKDPFGQPFIPGSSLKGCIRTAIIFSALKSLSNISVPGKILNKIFEKKRFQNKYIIPQNDFKYDLFKTLVIRDSHPFRITTNKDNLPTLNEFAVCQIRIVKKTSNGLKNQGGFTLAECLLTKNSIEIPFYIDKFILGKLIEYVEEDSRPAVEKIQSILSYQEEFKNALLDFSNELMTAQENFYNSSKENNPLKEDFQRAKNEKQILLQLGFNTGYLSKTVALVYQPEERLKIQKILHLGIANNYTEEIPFPRSRKLATSPQTPQKTTLPMGWFKLEVDFK